jgi:hypothetical protein
MSDERDKALLVEFADYLDGLRSGLKSRHHVDTFLASRHRSRSARSVKIPGPSGPISLTPLCDDCELSDDHCPTCERKPPAETHTDASQLQPQTPCEHGRPGGWLCPHCNQFVGEPPRETEWSAKVLPKGSEINANTDVVAPSPVPQRFWKLHHAHGTTGHIAWECDRTGMVLCRITPICGTYQMGRETPEAAEQDGVDSGLPRWTGEGGKR